MKSLIFFIVLVIIAITILMSFCFAHRSNINLKSDQVAIIFASTKGLMDTVPVNKARAFEKEFIAEMNNKHKDVIDSLGQGKFDDSLTDVLRTVAKEIAKNYA